MKPSSQNRRVAVVWNTTPSVWGVEKLGQEPLTLPRFPAYVPVPVQCPCPQYANADAPKVCGRS